MNLPNITLAIERGWIKRPQPLPPVAFNKTRMTNLRAGLTARGTVRKRGVRATIKAIL
jgi:hypothetical protein